jgi:hypothetical protein
MATPKTVKLPFTKQRIPRDMAIAGGGAAALLLGVILMRRRSGPTPEDIMREIEAARGQTVPGTSAPAVNLYDAANEIADALGVNVPWWNPGRWTEDEERAVNVILGIPDDYMADLESIYAALYTRNLRNDMQKYGYDYWKGINWWDVVKHKFL